MLRRLPLRPLGVISRSRRVEHILASLVGFVFVIWWVSYGSKSPFTPVAWRETRVHAKRRLELASIAIGSTLLVFFALLLNWSEHPAEVVHGVQGKYFTIPILALAYVLVSYNKVSQVGLKRCDRLRYLDTLRCLRNEQVTDSTIFLIVLIEVVGPAHYRYRNAARSATIGTP
jgi:hypothetical protein